MTDLTEAARSLRARLDNAQSLEELRGAAPTGTAKESRRDNLTEWAWAELDTLTGTGAGSIAAMTTEIQTLTALGSRTVAQNARLDLLRSDRTNARRFVRLARLVLLLDGSRARDTDVGGSDG